MVAHATVLIHLRKLIDRRLLRRSKSTDTRTGMNLYAFVFPAYLRINCMFRASVLFITAWRATHCPLGPTTSLASFPTVTAPRYTQKSRLLPLINSPKTACTITTTTGRRASEPAAEVAAANVPRRHKRAVVQIAWAAAWCATTGTCCPSVLSPDYRFSVTSEKSATWLCSFCLFIFVCALMPLLSLY